MQTKPVAETSYLLSYMTLKNPDYLGNIESVSEPSITHGLGDSLSSKVVLGMGNLNTQSIGYE